MQLWLKRLCGQSLRLLVLLSALMFIQGCNSLPLGKLLGSKGTNVAANTQIGAENNQVLGTANSYAAQEVTVPQNQGTAPTTHRVEQSQGQENKIKSDGAGVIVYNDNSLWLIVIALIGWVLPSPQEIANRFRRFVVGVFR
jgi:hypothetical protein